MTMKISKLDVIGFLRKRALLILGIFLFLSVLFLAFIFYQFFYIVIIQEPKISPSKFEFRKDLLDEFQGHIQAREETLKMIEVGGYRDVFSP